MHAVLTSVTIKDQAKAEAQTTITATLQEFTGESTEDRTAWDTKGLQAWAMRETLVDGQGNFGSVEGDPPAAMRYTEARLKKIAEEMLADIDKDTVDFRNNFDDTLQEPTVLPSKIPNLLVNGSSGIAVGMATNMAPHNITEVITAIIAFIENKEIRRSPRCLASQGYTRLEVLLHD